jgi:hypothetical protein
MPKPKKEKYLVQFTLVAYKEVMATSPEEALEIAEENPPGITDFDAAEGPEVIDMDGDNSNN